MQLRKKLYTPMWRDPEYLRAQQRDRRFRWLLGGLTVGCGLCLALPERFAYGKAISFQLAEGAVSARLLFGVMFLTLVYLTIRFWLWGHRLAAVASLVMVFALGGIALTDPRSGTHNGIFIVLILVICSMHAALFYIHVDSKLLVTAAGAFAGLLMCPFSLGMGERLIIGSSCLALNVLYYDYLDP